MLFKVKQFIWKHWLIIAQVFLFGVTGILILVGGILFLSVQIQNIGYRVSNADTTIEITDKQAQELTKKGCEVQAEEGCAVVRVITTTRYIILTTSETFFTEEDVYNNLEVGQKATVTVVGWRNSMFPPRRIVELVDSE